MPTPRASVNQQCQIGLETTPGTSVAASKLLDAFIWTFGPKIATKQFRGTGRQHPSASAVLTEYAGGKISGSLDFAQSVYPLSSLFGAATITTHSGATTVKDWKWTPALTGSYAANAKTFTLQNGEASDAEQYAYAVFTAFGYNFTRKQEAQITSDWISQSFTDGVTLTASPTTVAQYPATGADFNLYLDSTSAGIGTTQLLDPLNVAWTAGPFYDPYWPINRTNASFTSIIDKEKKQELKVKLQGNSTGIAIKGNYLENGARCYVRVSGQGQLIENDVTVGVGAASGGTFTLTYKGQTTAGIAYNATAGTVQTAFTGLSTVGSGNATVTGTAPNWVILLTGTLANDTTAITGSGSGLTGGALVITAAPVYAAFTHDMCLFVAEMSEFGNTDDVFDVEYTFILAEDTAWGSGQSQLYTLTNTLTAL
ncbi:MAG: hypothetical protein KGH75_00715 [Rhodospirillales bacterium]|nr:hypothetical protein [Rhodospirillales bacterium]